MAGYGPPRGGGGRGDRYMDQGPPPRSAMGGDYGYGPGPRGDYGPPPPGAGGPPPMRAWGAPPAAAGPPMGGPPPKTTLFVAGFPAEMRAADLAYYFERFGPLLRCDIPALRTQTAKPYAFIEYEDPRDAAAAHAEMHGVRFGGAAISIQFAKNAPSANWRFDTRGPPPPGARGGGPPGRGAPPRRRSPSPRRGAPSGPEDRYRGRDERNGERRERGGGPSSRGGREDRRGGKAGRDDRRGRGAQGEDSTAGTRQEVEGAAGTGPSAEEERQAPAAISPPAGGDDAVATAAPAEGREASASGGADDKGEGDEIDVGAPGDENALTPPPAAVAVAEDDDDEAEPVVV